MNESQLYRILNDLAASATPEDIDLWPAIQSQFETSKIISISGESSMNARLSVTQRLRFAAVVAISTLIFTVILFSTPQGLAWAQSVWRFFTRAESNTRLVPTVPPTLVNVPDGNLDGLLPAVTTRPPVGLSFQEACGSEAYPRCSVAEIRAMVAFSIQELTELPGDYEFSGATGGPERVFMRYQSKAGLLEFSQELASASGWFSWPVGSRAVVEPVAIGVVSGEYVQGAWIDAGQNAGSVQWNPDIPSRVLRWEEAGIIYTLQFMPAKTDEGIEPDRAMLVEFATHLSLEPVGAGAPVSSRHREIEDVAAIAGFEVDQPGWVPERFAFVDAEYVSGRNTVCQYYRSIGLEGFSELVIVQSPELITLEEILLPPQFVNGVQIDIPVYTETVTLSGAVDNQALYVSNGLLIEPLCGAQELPANHVLMWQSNGKSFVISTLIDAYDGRGFLTRLEMRRLAESLTGVGLLSPSLTDPEHLPSVEVAEALAGFDIKVPAQLPAGVRFAYAIYRGPNDPADPLSYGGSSEVVQVYFASTRDSVERYHSYLFFQRTAPSNTLEEIATGGGEWVAVNGMPAVYSEGCWQGASSGSETACMLSLSWVDEQGMHFDLQAYLPGALEKEQFLTIAESMH